MLKFFEKQKVIVKSKDGAPSVSIKQLIKALEKELVFHKDKLRKDEEIDDSEFDKQWCRKVKACREAFYTDDRHDDNDGIL